MLRYALSGVFLLPSCQEPQYIPPESDHALNLAELNTEQIRALDRDKTIVLIPVGVLEEHGPYLPSFTDGYISERVTDELARAVVARPEWTVLRLPILPFGVAGANEIGGVFSFPGTYSLRSETLRAILVDLGSELGEQGFKWIFVVSLHGAPNHHRALNNAGDYFRDTYGGRMVNLMGLMPVWENDALEVAPEAAENGFYVEHAGRWETSGMLFIRPDLVADGYQTAPSLPGENWDDLMRIAAEPGWPGYFFTPMHASAAQGEARIQQQIEPAVDYMWRIVEGADERDIGQVATIMEGSEPNVRIDQAALVEEQARAERFSAWLEQRRRRP